MLLDPYLQAWAAELGQPLSDRPLNEFPELPSWVPAGFAAKTGIRVEACLTTRVCLTFRRSTAPTSG
ncbi:MAG: hypothetical protein HC899_13280 [Leptolyngbyaceae cyanobacterium SM1_4_3]|nr:hypothetical protein [Leptolyngbyaceae cyanobacterium SM1_4_3]